MNYVSILFIVLMGWSSNAIELGDYICMGDPLIGHEAYQISVLENQLIIHNTYDKVLSDVFELGTESDKFFERPITQFNVDMGLEYYKYKFFRIDKNTLYLDIIDKYTDEAHEVRNENTLTRVSDSSFELKGVETNAGQEYKYLNLCVKTESFPTS